MSLHSLTRRRLMGAASLMAGASWRSIAAQTPEATPNAVQRRDDAVSGTFPLAAEQQTLRVLVPSNPRVTRFADNANLFSQWYQARTNVRIEWEVIEAEDASTVLRTRLLAGEMPDVLLGFDPQTVDLALFTGNNRLVDLARLVDEEPLELARVFSEVPGSRKVMTSRDGAVWSLPEVNLHRSAAYPFKLFVLQPWLDAVGLPMPRTTDEFRAMLIAFTDGDPNRSGVRDDIPLTGAIDTPGGAVENALLNAFVFNPGAPYIFARDGMVRASYLEPGWRDGILFLRDLVAQRLIDSNAFEQHGSDVRAKTNGDTAHVGVAPGVDWSSFIAWDPFDTGKRWAQYALMPALTGPSGVGYAAHNPHRAVTPGSMLVTTACPDPALAYRWANGLYDAETTLRNLHGPLDAGWRWASNGETGIDGERGVWARVARVPVEGEPDQGWAGTGPSYQSASLVGGEVAPSPEAAGLDLDVLSDRVLGVARQPDDWWLPPLEPTLDEAVTIATVEASLVPYVRDALVRWVTGEGSIDAEWDGFLAYLDNQGVQEYLEAYQQALDRA